MIRLRQSTASQEVPLGPFVDANDGFTLEDGLGPIAASDIRLWKSGAGALVDASGTATTIGDGTYLVTLDATDTNTLGPLVITVTLSGARPVRIECEVLPALVYDSLQVNTGIAADARAINGDVDSASKLGTFGNTIAIAVVGDTSTTTSVKVATAFTTPPEIFTVADQMKGKRILFTTNASQSDGITGQGARVVASSTPSGGLVTLTVEPPLATAPLIGDILVFFDGATPGLTPVGHAKASIEALQESTQAATNLRRQGLAAATGTLAAASTTTVLNISSITPALSDANQLKSRVVLIVDESGSEAQLKVQGGRISASTTTTITLEQPLTRAPAAGNVFIVV